MAILLLPILLSCLIRNLKFLAPLSSIANVFMVLGIAITLYYTSTDLPEVPTKNYVAELHQLPLFFGTALFAFEGIGLVRISQSSRSKEIFTNISGVTTTKRNETPRRVQEAFRCSKRWNDHRHHDLRSRGHDVLPTVWRRSQGKCNFEFTRRRQVSPLNFLCLILLIPIYL